MPDKQPRKLPAGSFASFENPGAATGRRRKATWPLRPMHEPHAGEATDAARRFVTEAALYAGTARKPAKE
jgi:hypothetical protein